MIIAYAYFRDFNNVDSNIEDEKIKPHIFAAEQELKFLIGKSFYDEISSQYESADDTDGLSADNLAFYDPYLIQWLAKQAFVNLCTLGNVRLTRTGIRTFNDDASDKAPDKNIAEFIRMQKQYAEQYKGRMINYLKAQQGADSSKYPLFDDDTCETDKFGTQFHITAVTKTEDVYDEINRQILYGS